MKEKKQLETNLNSSNTVSSNEGGLSITSSSDTLKLNLQDFKYYEVDWDKVNSLEDLKALLKAAKFCFSKQADGFNDVKHLLKDID